jgi:hypothetical protein
VLPFCSLPVHVQGTARCQLLGVPPWYQYQWTSCRPIAPLRRPQTYDVENQVAELPKLTVLDIRPLHALGHAALTAFQTGNANILSLQLDQVLAITPN